MFMLPSKAEGRWGSGLDMHAHWCTLPQAQFEYEQLQHVRCKDILGNTTARLCSSACNHTLAPRQGEYCVEMASWQQIDELHTFLPKLVVDLGETWMLRVFN